MNDKKRREEDKRDILRPHTWPCFPLLPMKRRGSNGQGPELGCLFGHQPNSEGFVLYKSNMYDLDPNKVNEKEVFETLDQLLDAGWMVD